MGRRPEERDVEAELDFARRTGRSERYVERMRREHEIPPQVKHARAVRGVLSYLTYWSVYGGVRALGHGLPVSVLCGVTAGLTVVALIGLVQKRRERRTKT